MTFRHKSHTIPATGLNCCLSIENSIWMTNNCLNFIKKQFLAINKYINFYIDTMPTVFSYLFCSQPLSHSRPYSLLWLPYKLYIEKSSFFILRTLRNSELVFPTCCSIPQSSVCLYAVGLLQFCPPCYQFCFLPKVLKIYLFNFSQIFHLSPLLQQYFRTWLSDKTKYLILLNIFLSYTINLVIHMLLFYVSSLLFHYHLAQYSTIYSKSLPWALTDPLLKHILGCFSTSSH